MKSYLVTMGLLLALSSSALAVQPGLKAGTTAPDFELQAVDGKSFKLSQQLKQGPVVLVFYRGGWCPYCNRQLQQLENQLQPKLAAYKAQLVAISVDKPQNASQTQTNEKLSFTVLSDPHAKTLKQYRIENRLPQELVTKYKADYKIDIEGASGQKHHVIAIPAVFVVDATQKIRFSYANENYKVRAQIADIEKALKNLAIN